MKGQSNKTDLTEVAIKTSAAQADTNGCNQVKFSKCKNVWISGGIESLSIDLTEMHGWAGIAQSA